MTWPSKQNRTKLLNIAPSFGGDEIIFFSHPTSGLVIRVGWTNLEIICNAAPSFGWDVEPRKTPDFLQK